MIFQTLIYPGKLNNQKIDCILIFEKNLQKKRRKQEGKKYQCSCSLFDLYLSNCEHTMCVSGSCVCVCVYVYVYVCLCVCLCLSVSGCLCVSGWLAVCVSVSVSVCVWVHMYVSCVFEADRTVAHRGLRTFEIKNHF